MGEATMLDADTMIEVDAVVVGAGLAGMYALRKLRDELELSVQAFDKATDVGEVWYWNNFPGARTDTEATNYCYFFDPDVYQSWEWTERFPKRDEILRYLGHVADRYDLRRSIQFETAVVEAVFDDARGRWIITTNDGQTWSAQFVIQAVGLLSSTYLPPYPGIESYRGQIVHSARRPREPVDLTGNKIAVIGTGSTGVQVITAIAPEIEHLHVLRRSAQWAGLAKDGPGATEYAAAIKSDVDSFWARIQRSKMATPFPQVTVIHDEVTERERDADFERACQLGGGFRFLFGTFADLMQEQAANKTATDFVARKISQIVKDPVTAGLLTPTEIWARRPLQIDGWYETFNRPNVSMVDINAHPVAEFTETGIRTGEGDIDVDVDVVIFATGFGAVTGGYLSIDQHGRDGVSLADKWTDRPRSFVATMTVGFPNWFMLFGPMGVAPAIIPLMIETIADWICAVIDRVRDTDSQTIEVAVDLEEQWATAREEASKGSLFFETKSWITGASIPGKRAAVMTYLGGVPRYCDEVDRVNQNQFADLQLMAAPSPAVL